MADKMSEIKLIVVMYNFFYAYSKVTCHDKHAITNIQKIKKYINSLCDLLLFGLNRCDMDPETGIGPMLTQTMGVMVLCVVACMSICYTAVWFKLRQVRRTYV